MAAEQGHGETTTGEYVLHHLTNLKLDLQTMSIDAHAKRRIHQTSINENRFSHHIVPCPARQVDSRARHILANPDSASRYTACNIIPVIASSPIHIRCKGPRGDGRHINLVPDKACSQALGQIDEP
mgnify:CR=1 FL=1